MAVHTGSAGVVKISSNVVAEVTAFTMETTADVIESTQLSDTNKTYEVSRKGGTVTVECAWDETDSNGQIVLQEATGVTLLLYPEGSDSGDTYYSGSAIINSIGVSQAHDGLVERSFGFQVSGALTITTV